MPPSRKPVQNSAPLQLSVPVVIAGAAAAIGLSGFSLPGFLALALAITVAGWLFVNPPAPARGEVVDAAAARLARAWDQLRWRVLFPNDYWLMNNPADIDGYMQKAAKLPLPGFAEFARPVLKVFGLIAWLILPGRFLNIVALGLAAIVLTLPTNAVIEGFQFPDWVPWVNALAAYLSVTVSENAILRTATVHDPSPGVRLSSVADAVADADSRGGAIRSLVGFPLLGAATATGAVIALGYFDLLHFSSCWPAAAIGLGALVTAACLHGAFRSGALEAWRDTVAARAAWDKRWEGLKQPDTFLVDHARVGQAVVDTFDAPPMLGSAGAINLYQKVVAFLGGGNTVAMLTCPDTDSQGQPQPGTIHATRFRVVVWPSDATVDISSAATDESEVELRLETAMFTVATTGRAGAEVPVLVKAAREDCSVDGGAIWASQWTALIPGPESVSEFLQADAFADRNVLYAGALDGADAELAGLRERITVTERWTRRWTDALQQGANPPVLQYDHKQEGRLADGTVIHYQPFLFNQGIDIKTYFDPKISRKLATTLAAAPFVTVVGFPHGGPGDRHPQAFSVVWSERPIPASPAKLTPAPARDAIRWALGGMVNAAFDAAKLDSRPEIVEAAPLTSRRSQEHIWRIDLRLFDGVTAQLVKAKSAVIQQALGNVPWLRITEGRYGVTVYAGANPRAENVTLAGDKARATCDELDWEQAFIDAKVIGNDGTTPKMMSRSPLESNPKVTIATFQLPSPLTASRVHAESDKLRSASRNDYVDVREEGNPSVMSIRFSEQNPIPFPAFMDWDKMSETDGNGAVTLPFASAVDGSAVGYTWIEDPHLMVLGGSGSGKSLLLQVLIVASLTRGCEVYTLDPVKGGGDFEFAKPWLKGFVGVDDWVGAGETMRYVHQEVQRRKKLRVEHGVSKYSELPEEIRPPHAIVIVDEFQSLINIPDLPKEVPTDPLALADYESLKAGIQGKRNVASAIGYIAREARSDGVTLILAGQALKSAELAKVGLAGLKDIDMEARIPVPVSERFPDGWARNRDLLEGDLLFAADGTTTPVVGFSDEITHDTVYDVVFDDGHTVRTGPGHLWLASDAELRRVAMKRAPEKERLAQRMRERAAAMEPGTLMDVETLAAITSLGSAHVSKLIGRFGIEKARVKLDGTVEWMPRGRMVQHMYVDAAEFLTAYANLQSNKLDHERVVTTEEMLATLAAPSASHSYRWSVRVAEAISGDDADLPVEPYALGAWLGDGASASGLLYSGVAESTTDEAGVTDQEHLISYLATYEAHPLKCGPIIVGTKGLKAALREAGVLGNKHIPAMYLRASFDQRLALLQGLMDTDGSILADGTMSFCQVNQRLAGDVRELIETLGIKVSRHDRLTPGGKPVTHLKFRTTLPVFRLPRKLARVRGDLSENAARTRRRIVDIRPVSGVPTRCIAVAHPEKLFLVEGFIPTHNTNFSRIAMGKMNYGDLASAFKDTSTLPRLGEVVPRGRGLYESNADAAQIIQGWYEPGGQDEMRRHIEIAVPKLDPSDQLDVDALREKVLALTAPSFGEIIETEEGGDAVVEVDASDLGVDLSKLSTFDFASLDEDDDDITPAGDTAAESAPANDPSDSAIAESVAPAASDSGSAPLRSLPVAEFELVEPPTDADLTPAQDPAPVEAPVQVIQPALFAMPEEAPAERGSETLIVASDPEPGTLVFGDDLPLFFDAPLTGWSEGDAVLTYLDEHPEVGSVEWHGDGIDEMDEIGVPHRAVMVDALEQRGVQLIVPISFEPKKIDTSGQPDIEF